MPTEEITQEVTANAVPEDDLAIRTWNAIIPLRTMAICEENGLLHVEGRDQTPKPGRTLITRTTVNGDRFERVLFGDELLGYGNGALAAAGLPYLAFDGGDRERHADVIAGMEPPRLLTVEQAAQEFLLPEENKRTGLNHLTTDGVISKIHRREFEVIYFPRRERRLFQAEIHALRASAGPEDRDNWRQMAEWLGLGRRLKITPANLPAPGKPYRISDAKPHITRCLQVMLSGHEEGWFRYAEPVETDHGLQFHIRELAGHPGKSVNVPETYALHWALGVADHFSPTAGELVAYRDGIA